MSSSTLGILDIIAAFLLGAIPFGYVIGRCFYHTDLRAHGSGNIGTINALRTLGKGGAVAVLLLDALKGFIPVWIGLYLDNSSTIAAVAAAAAMLGHCYSPWLGWKGGKGVATALGALFALSWQSGLIAIACWLLGALTTQFSSVGSMLAALSTPFTLLFFTGSYAPMLYGLFSAVFVLYTHRENITRLRTGTENKMRKRSSTGA